MAPSDIALDFGRFDALTFDCYGTLIDWESGILEAVRTLAGDRRVELPEDEELLEIFARLEAEAELGTFRLYREVLEDVAVGMAMELGFGTRSSSVRAFAESVGDWPAFSDTSRALAALGGRYRLAIVSNVDDDLFERTAERLGIAFAEVVTAEQVRSYKPATAHFHEAFLRLDLPRERILHVAQSLYHDIVPARSLGLRCVWVNRRTGRRGTGATRPAAATPDLEVPDLDSLARAAGVL
jgi:2-haloacid dehalogenase